MTPMEVFRNALVDAITAGNSAEVTAEAMYRIANLVFISVFSSKLAETPDDLSAAACVSAALAAVHNLGE